MPTLTRTSRRISSTMANGHGERRCPGCREWYPATDYYFYTYPNGRLERCNSGGQDCHGRYYRARAEARRSGRTTPRATSPRFGVEIEFTGASREAVAQALTDAGIRCSVESYNHTTRRHWKIVTDASVRGGGELVSPPLSGAAGLREIETVCQALRAAGASADSSCGLHVHHEMRGHTPESFGRAFGFWQANQNNIGCLVAASRRRSQWCQPLSTSEVAHIAHVASVSNLVQNRSSFRVDRYRSLNVQSYPRYGTVEIRQHQGTVNGRKMVAWIEFGQAFFRLAKNTNVAVGDFGSVNQMLDSLVNHAELSAETAEYLKARAVSLASRPHREPLVSTEDVDRERCSCGEMLDAEGRCPIMFSTPTAAR